MWNVSLPSSPFQPAGFSIFSSPSHSLSRSLSLSFGYIHMSSLLSEGHSVNPNINNEWKRVGAPLWPPACVLLCIRSLCECVGGVTECVCVCVWENIPDWWEVMTESSALPSSIILSFRTLWLSTFSLKLWNTQRSSSLSCFWFQTGPIGHETRAVRRSDTMWTAGLPPELNFTG